MPVEIKYLIGSLLLYLWMILVQALFSNLEHGLFKLAGARDGIVDQNLRTQRAKRATANMVESLMLFVPFVLVAAYLDRLNGTTALGAALFFWGRLAYAPLYWLGVPWLRTLAWAVAGAGIILILTQIWPY